MIECYYYVISYDPVKKSLRIKEIQAMKSYFDPVLEKTETIPKLNLQEESIILYDNYDKISSLHIYTVQ